MICDNRLNLVQIRLIYTKDSKCTDYFHFLTHLSQLSYLFFVNCNRDRNPFFWCITAKVCTVVSFSRTISPFSNCVRFLNPALKFVFFSFVSFYKKQLQHANHFVKQLTLLCKNQSCFLVRISFDMQDRSFCIPYVTLSRKQGDKAR